MLEKELEDLISTEQDVIPFLKKLSTKDKRSLVPFIKEFRTKIFETKEKRKKNSWGFSSSWENIHSLKKRDLVDKVCYVCFNKTDTKKLLFNVNTLSLSDDYINNILPWYTPKWFGDFLNKDAQWGLDYGKLMQLHKDGYFEPSQELILRALPGCLVKGSWKNKEYTSYYKPEVLHIHKDTIEKHIWYMFEEESNIQVFYTYTKVLDYEIKHGIWVDTFINLISKGKIDRRRLLIATIYTSTKGFNKSLSGYFFDMLVKLEPSKEEMLSLQNELFSALNCPHSKVVNSVLKFFKLIASDSNFHHQTFIENATILLNSETKSVVSSTLMILEKIAKSNQKNQVAVSIKAAEALINVDEKIQLRAAKLIAKYGDTNDEALKNEVCVYTENIFHAPRELLKEYIARKAVEPAVEVEELEVISVLSAENKIPSLSTVDELIFFISQVLDNNEVYNIDLFLNYLPKLSALLNESNVDKLESIFKRAFDLTVRFDWSSKIGYLEREAACYLNDFALYLIDRFPNNLQDFKNLRIAKIKELKANNHFTKDLKHALERIENQSTYGHIYKIHRLLSIKSKNILNQKLELDLVSTPTHHPCWVDPVVFINRIIAYEKALVDISIEDFQIAIGRLPINEYPNDINALIDEIYTKEVRTILKYHYDLLDIKSVKIENPELWIQSVLVRNKQEELEYFESLMVGDLKREKGAYDWGCRIRDRFYQDYDYKLKKNVQKKMIVKELKFQDFNQIEIYQSDFVSNIKSFFNYSKKFSKVNSIYNHIHFKKEKYFTTIQSHDDVKFLFLSPNNPSMYLSHVIHTNLKESTLSSEGPKRNMVNLLKGLYEIWNRPDFKEPVYLFLGSGLLCSDKISRELAAEIWIKANSRNLINNQLLGSVLGRLQHGEYAPMKRFTDLLTSNLFNVSKKHNVALFEVLGEMIAHMSKEPLRGLKKMVELYAELSLSHASIDIAEPTKLRLRSWGSTKSLQPVLTKMGIS